MSCIHTVRAARILTAQHRGVDEILNTGEKEQKITNNSTGYSHAKEERTNFHPIQGSPFITFWNNKAL